MWSRSVSTGRGFGASAPGVRCFRPARETPMWSGPRRLPVPVIAPGRGNDQAVTFSRPAGDGGLMVPEPGEAGCYEIYGPGRSR
jgi:hypothetical protein